MDKYYIKLNNKSCVVMFSLISIILESFSMGSACAIGLEDSFKNKIIAIIGVVLQLLLLISLTSIFIFFVYGFEHRKTSSIFNIALVCICVRIIYALLYDVFFYYNKKSNFLIALIGAFFIILLSVIGIYNMYAKKAISGLCFAITACVSLLPAVIGINEWIESDFSDWDALKFCGDVFIFVNLEVFAASNRLPIRSKKRRDRQMLHDKKYWPEKQLEILKERLECGELTIDEFKAARQNVIETL